MRKISAANLDICPECAAETFSKQLSAPSFQLNGSGWYATDFKNGSGKAAVKSDANSASNKDNASNKDSTSSTDGAKSEAAPAATACATGCACH